MGRRESDILYESGDFWVCKNHRGDFEVYHSGLTHSVRVAVIGRGLSGGSFKRAREEADRRHAIEAYEDIAGGRVSGVSIGEATHKSSKLRRRAR